VGQLGENEMKPNCPTPQNVRLSDVLASTDLAQYWQQQYMMLI